MECTEDSMEKLKSYLALVVFLAWAVFMLSQYMV